MGGNGSGGLRQQHGYIYPICLTKEMKISFMKLCSQQRESQDFNMLLKVIRAGLSVYGALTAEDIESMYFRLNSKGEQIISFNELCFLDEKKLVDMNPILEKELAAKKRG